MSETVAFGWRERLHTVYLCLQPRERPAVELLLRRAVGEAVCDLYVREELEHAALHGQFVQVRVEQGRDALGRVRDCRGHVVFVVV